MGALIIEVDFGDLEAYLFFYSVLLLVKSISLTSRHDFDSLLGDLHLGEVDFVGFEVLI